MATFKLVLREDKRRADLTAPIYLRITQDRRSHYVNTEIAVEPRYWNAKRQKISKSHLQHRVLNDALEALLANAKATSVNIKNRGRGPATALTLKRELKGKGSSALFPFAQAYADEWLAKGKYWEWRKVNVLIRKLKEFSKREDLTFSDIDRAFLDGLSSYMGKKLGNKRSTQQKNLQILRGIMKRAVIAGLIDPSGDPFLYYPIGSTPGDRERLQYADILKLRGLDLPAGSPIDIARDTFLFSFYVSGMRFGDLCALRWRSVVAGRLNYTMMKSGKVKSVKLVPEAEEILAKYRREPVNFDALVFPVLEPGRDYTDPVFLRRRISAKNVGINVLLKELARKIETPINLTFHVARHTFADHARRVSGNIDAVSKALGHSKISTTQAYISGTDVETEDALLDAVFRRQEAA